MIQMSDVCLSYYTVLPKVFARLPLHAYELKLTYSWKNGNGKVSFFKLVLLGLIF